MMILTESSLKSVGQFLALLIVFIFVLFITYFSTKVIADIQKNQISGSNIKLHEAARLSQNKYIQIVQIGQKYYALAICKDTVTVIDTLDPNDLDLQGKSVISAPNFAGILEKIKNKPDDKDK